MPCKIICKKAIFLLRDSCLNCVGMKLKGSIRPRQGWVEGGGEGEIFFPQIYVYSLLHVTFDKEELLLFLKI
jgi:hypothetical protein